MKRHMLPGALVLFIERFAITLVLTTLISAQSDNLIVPGEGVGSVRLGMYREDVTRALGKPSKVIRETEWLCDSYHYGKENGYLHYIKVCYHDAPYRASLFEIHSNKFATAEGIRTGGSIRDVLRAYGDGRNWCAPPPPGEPASRYTCLMSYKNGITFWYMPESNEIWKIDVEYRK